MRRDVENEKRELYSQMFMAFFYTLLFLVMAVMCGCGGGSSSGGTSSAAKVLASIVIQPADNKLAIGKTQQFTAIGKYSDGTLGSDMGASVSWLSSSPSVASITPNGMVSAIAVGQTTITASSGGFTGTTTLTVPDTKLVSIAITPVNQLIAVGTTQQYSATGAYSDGTFETLTSSVTWNSSNTAAATIVAGGKASAVAGGSTTITAVLGAVTSNSTLLTVSTDTLISIDVTPTSQIVAVGMTKQFKATGTFSGGTQDLTSLVTWNSTNNSAATIGLNDGKASAVGLGSTVITASLGSITSPAATLTVKSLSSIAVAPITFSVEAGKTKQFFATGTFIDSTTQDLTDIVTWSSSDKAIASVGQDGKAMGESAGSATISAGFGLFSGSGSLTVTPAVVTGLWVGTYTIYEAVDINELGTYPFRLEMSQSGANITGTSTLRIGTSRQVNGTFSEGTVTGRHINFKFTYIDPRFSNLMVNIGTAAIIDNTLTGEVVENFNGGYNCSYIFNLQKM